MRIAIAGAGIGGLTAALTLSPLADEIVVVERRTGFGEGGAGIQLSPNASRILIELGLESVLRRVGSEPDGIVVRDLRSGREIGRVGLGRAVRERFGAPYLHVTRADLHTALLDLVRSRRNVRLMFGRALSSVADGAGGARLRLETSTGSVEEIEADLAVGADGLWSAVRTSIGDTRAPVFSGYAALRATIAAEKLSADLRAGGGLWLGRGCHVVHYPVSAGRQVNVVAVVRRPALPRGWSFPESPEAVQDAFSGATPALGALIAAAETWTAWSLFDLPVTALGRGRIALLGDAGHPALPFVAQGGAMAIEDAAVLAAEVKRAAQDVGEAVRRYATRRFGRVRQVQAASRKTVTAYHASGPVALVRNMVMRRLGPSGTVERYAWIYGWTPRGT